MQDAALMQLRRITLPLRRVTGAILILELVRKMFARAGRPVWVSDFDGHLRLRLRLDEHMQSQIFWYGYYSRDIVLLLDRLLRPGMVVCDVGANIGEITLAAARRVGAGGRVYAFEPMPALYARLCEHLSLNGIQQVTAVPMGLADRGGRAVIYRRDTPYADGTVNEGLGSLFADGQRSSAAGEIELTTLDDYCAQAGIERLDLLKIDVEGAELAVLRGGAKTIERYLPFIIVEVQEQTADNAGYTVQELIFWLLARGYTLFTIGRKGRLHRFVPERREEFQNVLAVPAGVDAP